MIGTIPLTQYRTEIRPTQVAIIPYLPSAVAESGSSAVWPLAYAAPCPSG